MKKILLVILLITAFNVKGQNVSCTDLLDFIKENGTSYGNIGAYTLNSSWLYEVTAYSYNGKIYVVAKIKESQYSYQTKSYVFCGIPSANWNSFKYGSYDDSDSYGERFHKYIIDYQCDCY